MTQHDVVVIGASAGGLPALTTVLQSLSSDFNAVVLVVMHTRTEGNGVLPAILARATALPVAFARDHEVPRRGHIYVAPPDFQLIATPRELRVLHGPRENGFRPAIDPLFRTAGRVWKSRVVGVILSGALDDGTDGLSTIKQFGGTAIVQAPEDAIIASMPQSAIRQVQVDHVLPAYAIGPLLERLSTEETMEAREVMAAKELEPQLPSEATEVADMERMFGAPSALTCPDCGGALWEIEEGGVLRYQCHTGHRFSSDSLDTEQRDAVDGALWSAVRVLEEHAELKLRMARRTAAGGLERVSAGFEEGARDAHQQAAHIRRLLFATGAAGDGPNRGARSVADAADAPHRPRAGRAGVKSKRAAGRSNGGRLRTRKK